MLSYTSDRPISIHALREEGDEIPQAANINDLLFLSTPSARRATCAKFYHAPEEIISIHALREEGDHTPIHPFPAFGISIHALREEGDMPSRAHSA